MGRTSATGCIRAARWCSVVKDGDGVFPHPILGLGTVLLLLLRLFPPAIAILVSAVGWGIAHSTVAPIWGLVIWWPFLIFSTLFVTWRERSLWLAFAVPMCVHGLQNLIPASMIAFGVSI